MQRSLPTGAWIASGLIAAALVVPGATYAAATLTQIVGTNGTTVAQVSKAHQLLTGPAAPSSMVSSHLLITLSQATTTACISAMSVPSGSNAEILRQIRYTVTLGGGSDDTIELYTDSSCIFPVAMIGFTPGNGSVPLDPGVALPAGGGLWAKAIDHTGADQILCFFDGYKVPAGAVPAASRVLTVNRTFGRS